MGQAVSADLAVQVAAEWNFPLRQDSSDRLWRVQTITVLSRASDRRLIARGLVVRAKRGRPTWADPCRGA